MIYLRGRYVGQGWTNTFKNDPGRYPTQARVLRLGGRYRVIDIVGGTH